MCVNTQYLFVLYFIELGIMLHVKRLEIEVLLYTQDSIHLHDLPI